MTKNCPLCLQGACMWKNTRGECQPPARLRARVEELRPVNSSRALRLVGGPYDGQIHAIEGSRWELFEPVIRNPLVPGTHVISPAKIGHYERGKTDSNIATWVPV